MKCFLVNSAVIALFSAFFVTYLNASRLPGFRSMVRPIEENSLSPIASYEPPRRQHREWVKVKHSGPRMSRVAAGTQMELECEASGSPPPSIQWLHGVQPVSQTVLESNSVSGVRLGTVKSILSIDCVTPRHQGAYTCIAQSGSETASSLPAMLYVAENVTNLMSSRPLCAQEISSSPRIITWTPLNMDTIGNDVLLPCVTVGNPAPQVYWLDKENELISSETKPDARYKLLDSGDLLISKVIWDDMGSYTCVAENPLGRDTISTFLYPLRRE